MAIELATAYVSLVLTNKDMPKQINSMIGNAASKSAADKAGESIGQRLSSGMGKALTVGAAAATATAVAGVGVALTKGFQRLTAIDDATAKLDGLGHTSLGVTKIMDSAMASVKGTAFGLGEAAKVSASAVAAGIKPGQDLTRYLTITADAATIAGVSMEEMGSVMNKVQAKGKAYTMDLNQMAIRGIPIYQMLAKEMNVTQEELMDMVSEGKVSADVYQKAIEKGMGGAARAGNSVSAAYANTMAAMGRLGAAALKPEFARSADWLKNITAAIDVLTPKVGKFADTMDAKIFNSYIPRIKEASAGVKEAWQDMMGENAGALGNQWDRVTSTVTQLGVTAKEVWPAIKSIAGSLMEASAALGVSTWSVFLGLLESSAVILDATLVPALNGLASVMEGNTWAVSGLLAAFLLFRTVPAIMARIAPSMASLAAQTTAAATPLTRYQRSFQAVGNTVNGTRTAFTNFFREFRNSPAAFGVTNQQMGRTSSMMLTMGERAIRTGDAIKGMGSKIAGAGSSLVSALGGGVGIGIMAAAIAIPQLISSAKNWDVQAKITAQFTDDVAESQRKMARAFSESKGIVDDNVMGELQKQSESYMASLQKTADSAPGMMDHLVGMGKNLMANKGMFDSDGPGLKDLANRKTEALRATETVDALKAMGVGADELSAALAGTNGQWGSFYKAASANEDVSWQTLRTWSNLRSETQGLKEASGAVSPVLYGLSDAFKVLSDDAASASTKASAFHEAMNLIAGIPPDLGDATSNFNQVLRETKKIFEEKLTPEGGALGGDLIDKVTGGIDTMSENGMQVRDAIQQIRKSGETLVAAGGDVDTALNGMNDGFKQVAEAAGITEDKLASILRAEGFTEDWFRTTAAVQGMSDVDAALTKIKFTKDSLKPGEPLRIPVEMLNDENVRKALDDMKLDLKEVNGGTHFDVVARTDDALGNLDNVVRKALEIEALKVQMGVDMATEAFDYKAGNTQDMVKFLSGLEVKPGSDIDMKQFEGKKQLTMEEIQKLSEQVADPSVLLKGIQQLITDAGTVKTNLDEAAKPRTANITIAWSGDLYAARRAAQPNFIGPISGTYKGARLPRNSTGSRLPTTGPGTDTVDGILGMGYDGTPTTWVDKGEWIINGKSSEKYNGLLAAINRDDPSLRNLPKYAEGGRNGIEAALSAGRSVTGNAYVWGGTGPTGFDCSGFVGWLQQIVMGIVGSTKRLYTTHAFMNGASEVAGLVKGLGPPGTQFQVGVNQEHMAATIAGQSAESGGSMGSSGIGPQWNNATSSQFGVQYHLPNSKIADWVEGQSSSGIGYSYDAKKKAEWTEANQLSLEKAELAITKAREARDKTDANAKATENDKRIAEKNVQIAEQRHVDLQAKKDRAAAGLDEGPPPQAPALERAYTEMERSRISAQLAVNEANARRNEVYADPEASDDDRLRADLALDTAEEAQREALKGEKEKDGDYSANGILKTFAHRAVDALFTGLEGQDYFGLMESRWLSTDWTKVIPENFTQEQVDSQLPVTPGEPNWLEHLFSTGDFPGIQAAGIEEDNPLVQAILNARGIRAPGKPRVFDNGGWLMPGETAINLSARPEPIFNSPEQLRQFGAEHIALPQNQGGSGESIDARIIFEGNVYARDDDELINRIRQESNDNIRALKKR